MYIQKSKAQKLDTITTYNLIRQLYSVRKILFRRNRDRKEEHCDYLETKESSSKEMDYVHGFNIRFTIFKFTACSVNFISKGLLVVLE